MSSFKRCFDINGKPLREYKTNNKAEKALFFNQVVEQKRHIAAFHFNDVFCEFSDLFYKGKPYKTVMASFKKWMQYIADKHGLSIIKSRTDYIDRHDYGMRVVWSIIY